MPKQKKKGDEPNEDDQLNGHHENNHELMKL